MNTMSIHTTGTRCARRSRLIHLLLWALLPVCALGARPTAAQPATQTHLVQAGDTWTALALRYGVPPAELWALNGVLNPLREPVIGATVQTPAAAPRDGRLLRPEPGSAPTLAALAHNLPPAALRQAATAATGRPWLIPYHALLLPVPGATPRDWPVGLRELALSAAPAVPGRAFGVRGLLAADVAAEEPLAVTLGRPAAEPLPVNAFRNGERLVALRGVGAFFPTGSHLLTVQVGARPLWSQPWLFAAADYPSQVITFTGAAAAIDGAAIAAERARLSAIWDQPAPPLPLWRAPFAEPVADYLAISSVYGTRRSTDGGNTYATYHEGVDYAAYGGTAVTAPAAGVVVIAEALYVRGGAVLINHGLGVYSGYYHLSEVVATAGNIVEAGELIGRVGTTGLSTGNHLHWDLLVGGSWVDAQRWAADGMDCWLLAAWGWPCATDG